MDRREILKSGAAAGAAALFPGLALSGAAGNADAAGRAATDFPAPEIFVFDNRFQEAVAVAREFSGQAQLRAVSGDMTSLWYSELNQRWREQPMTLAGVTARDALFVLSTLAPDYGMRVVQQLDAGFATFNPEVPGEPLPLYSWVIAPR